MNFPASTIFFTALIIKCSIDSTLQGEPSNISEMTDTLTKKDNDSARTDPEPSLFKRQFSLIKQSLQQAWTTKSLNSQLQEQKVKWRKEGLTEESMNAFSKLRDEYYANILRGQEINKELEEVRKLHKERMKQLGWKNILSSIFKN